MKIAGRSSRCRASLDPSSRFNGAGDEDRRKGQVLVVPVARAHVASTEPAMKIAGRRLNTACTKSPSTCFNGAGDEDRRKGRRRARHVQARAASTEPAMKIAGR